MRYPSLAVSSQLSIRVGTAGWSIPRAQAALFHGEDSHLTRYSRVLSCVEINSSFYRPHRPATYARWAASTPEHFRFSVKAPKAITHQSVLAPPSTLLEAFLDDVGNLAEKLGPVLFQFPPSQSFEERRARDFFVLFRKLYPEGDAAIEPRHPAWFSPEADRLLEEFQMTRVIADPPVMPQATRPAGNSGLVYYRLHGFPRIYYSSYPMDIIEKLAADISAQQALADVWCIFDNTASGAAMENALSLTHTLTEPKSAATSAVPKIHR